MNKKVYLPIILGAIALVVLYVSSLFGLTVPPSKLSPEHVHAADDGHNHAPKTDANGMPVMDIPQLDFESYLTKVKKKLHPKILENIEKLEKELAQSTDNHEKAHLLESLGMQYYEIKRYELASYYFVEYGFLENSEKYLTFASQIITEHLNTIEEPEVRFWMGANGVRALERLVELHPKDADIRIDLALMYIDGAGQPMKGVGELQSVVSDDSSNFRANIILGEMAIKSRQFDKAIERGNLILRYHPKSWEARVFMAYAYHNLGNKDEALRLLNEAKQFNTNKEFHKDVDSYIQSMN